MKYFRSAHEWERTLTTLLKETQMAFPNPACTCAKCTGHFAAARAARANPPDPYKPHLAALRAAAGQSHLNAAHDHIVQAGASCGESLPSGNGESNPPGNGERKHLAASAANRLFGPSLVKSTPDPYAMPNRALAANDLTPDLDPKYQPRGTAPNGYRIALAARKVNQ